METAKYHISLDVQESHSGVLLNMKQYDTCRRIYITLVSGGRPYEIASDCHGVFTAKKPDGTAIFNDCQVVGNTLVYDVTRQTTASTGELACEVRLYGGDQTLLTCAAFGILVSPGVVSDEDDIASMPEATALQTILDRVEKVEDFMDESILSDKAWSAKKLIDTLCPAFSTSGEVVTCYPVAGYPLAVSAEGSVTHLGKNRIPQPYIRGTTTIHGMTFTVNDDGSVTMDTNANATTGLATFAFLGKGTGANAQQLSAMGLQPGDTVTISFGGSLPEGVEVHSYLYNEAGAAFTHYAISSGERAKTITLPASASRIYTYIRVPVGVSVEGVTLHPMVEKGKTATAYAPYRCETVEPGTVTAWAGENTFLAESGDVTVSGRKDIISILEGI